MRQLPAGFRGWGFGVWVWGLRFTVCLVLSEATGHACKYVYLVPEPCHQPPWDGHKLCRPLACSAFAAIACCLVMRAPTPYYAHGTCASMHPPQTTAWITLPQVRARGVVIGQGCIQPALQPCADALARLPACLPFIHPAAAGPCAAHPACNFCAPSLSGQGARMTKYWLAYRA
jgi:hypothetical protein